MIVIFLELSEREYKGDGKGGGEDRWYVVGEDDGTGTAGPKEVSDWAWSGLIPFIIVMIVALGRFLISKTFEPAEKLNERLEAHKQRQKEEAQARREAGIDAHNPFG